MDIFGLKATKTLRRLLKIEVAMIQTEICFDHGDYKRTLSLMEKVNYLWDKHGPEIEWSEKEVEQWFLSRGKVRLLRDPMFSSEVHRTLNEWKRRNNLG